MASEKTLLEKFEVITVHRSAIKNADYNPRVMTDAARRKLKTGIKKLGMLGPIIWNKRTGSIVGGHQRVRAMDSLEKTSDYNLSVSAVDLTDKQEREANLLLNNAAAMGEFDVGKLEELLKFPDLEVEAAGWERADVYRLFGSIDLGVEDDQNAEAAQDLADHARKTHDELEAIRHAKDRNDNDGFFLCVVFRDYDERKAFTDQVGWDDNRYQSSDDLKALMGIESEP